ncbi:MAG: hypothetical protein M0011_14325 [Elusimicrobia bacterium]|nr:hypothetical protein [Elusimicrobiota bacterium]
MKPIELLVLAVLFLAQPAFPGEAVKVRWGSEVSQDYTVWRWIGAFTDEDESSWDELDAKQQTKVLNKALRACGKAQDKLSVSRGKIDGKALLAVSDGDLEYIGACFKDGEAAAAAVQEKRDKLAAIKARVDKGIYDQDDIAWLKEQNITLAPRPQNGEEEAKQLKERAKKQEKISAAANKKYGKMKDMDASGMGAVYDGGSGRKGDQEGGVELSEAKLGGAPPAPEARGPKKKLTFTAPPSMGDGPAPEGNFVWNGKKITAAQQAKLDKCRAQNCSLYEALNIVDPQKMKAPHNYDKPASRKEIVKMEKDFKALVGRDINFNDLLALRDDTHGPASGYESNNLAALEHKYFVNDQVEDAVRSCPDTFGLHGACVLTKKAVLRVVAPAVYESGKTYMYVEKNAAEGNPAAMAAMVIYLPATPVNLAVKGLVIGSKDGVSMETVKKTLRPADSKSLGSTPSGQNVLCAIGIFCGD